MYSRFVYTCFVGHSSTLGHLVEIRLTGETKFTLPNWHVCICMCVREKSFSWYRASYGVCVWVCFLSSQSGRWDKQIFWYSEQKSVWTGWMKFIICLFHSKLLSRFPHRLVHHFKVKYYTKTNVLGDKQSTCVGI